MESQSTRRGGGFVLRALTIVLLVPALLVLAWAAFGLQGYQNDPQSSVFQTWPIGVTSIALAGSLAWIAFRPAKESPQRLVTAAAFVTFVLSWVSVLS